MNRDQLVGSWKQAKGVFKKRVNLLKAFNPNVRKGGDQIVVNQKQGKDTRPQKNSPRINKAKQNRIVRSLKKSAEPSSMTSHFRLTLTM